MYVYGDLTLRLVSSSSQIVRCAETHENTGYGGVIMTTRRPQYYKQDTTRPQVSNLMSSSRRATNLASAQLNSSESEYGHPGNRNQSATATLRLRGLRSFHVCPKDTVHRIVKLHLCCSAVSRYVSPLFRFCFCLSPGSLRVYGPSSITV